jgi:probable HAF family extracellular repeat protein
MTKRLLHTLTISTTLQLLAALNSWGCTDTLTITNLSDAAGHTFQVTALSSSGLLTGFFGDQPHAFLYNDGAITDLGTLGGSQSVGSAINAAGQVAGRSLITNGDTHAFLSTDGQLLDLGTLGGGFSDATSINDAGQVVGASLDTGDIDTLAFLYTGGAMVNLGTLGGTYSVAFSINNLGVICGEASIPSEDTHGFIYSVGTMIDVGTLGGPYSSCVALNDAGTAIGTSWLANGDTHAFRYSAGTITDLGTLGGTYSEATAINNAGQILGLATTTNDQEEHAFFVSGGVKVDVGTLGGHSSEGFALNNHGQVVGQSATATGATHAFLWQNGTIIDLNSLLPPNSGWVLISARFINDSRRIVGNGFYLGAFQRFIMDLPNHAPVSDPGPDQTVDCQAPVTLDASHSSDPDGDTLAFQWSSSGTVLGTNSTLVASLPLGINVVTLKVTDPCGSSGQSNVNVIVVDITAPVISCPANLSVPSDANCQAAVPDLVSQLVASDNCTPPASLIITQNPAAGALIGLGTYPIQVAVTDEAGNAAGCSVLFTVFDAAPPVFLSVPGLITLSTDTNCQAAVPDVLGQILAADNCTPPNQLVMSQNPPAGTLLPRGHSMIMITVTDTAGNNSSTTVPLTIVDTTAPVITCPADVLLACGESTDPSNTGTATATDNCDQPVITFSDSSEDNCPSSPSHITRTWTATDSSGNVSSCAQNIYIQCCATGCAPISSAIGAGFNKTPISTANYIWFNANLSAGGIAPTGTTITFRNCLITITSAQGNFTYPVPDGTIVFSPSAACATTTFDSSGWVTTVPLSGSDEILLSALGIKAPANLQAASVTWSGYFSASTPGVSVAWKWGAAVYTQDMTQGQYNSLGVKPTHSKACLYQNSDHAGTPENMKSHVIGGARGGGGSNWTGGWSGTAKAKLCK